MRNFIGQHFTWFVGVVEDRNDPEQLGRVRVRAYGWHTDDKDLIPTDSLPWAQVVNGIQSGSVSGLGHSPTGIVEGAWVVGFFLDGDRAQEPMILGTVPGYPTQKKDPSKGFNDPNGTYPLYINGSDVNIAARESTYDKHPNRIAKEADRVLEIPTAERPRLQSEIDPDSSKRTYTAPTWNELPPANDSVPTYPNNHVFETENGLLQEFDDTPGFERHHLYHPSGTYEEIINDGSRTIKVVGKDYELYMDGVNMYVYGNLNVTCTGNKRELIKGNYHLKVEGDITENVLGSIQRQVQNHVQEEIGKNRAVNVVGNDYLTIMEGNQIVNIMTGYKQDNIKYDYSIATQGDFSVYAYGGRIDPETGDERESTINIFSTGNYALTSLQAMYNTAKETTQYFEAGTVTIDDGDVVVKEISHVEHVHGGVSVGGATTGEPE